MAAIPSDLSDAERQVWEAFRTGDVCDFAGRGVTYSADWALPRGDLGADWGPERTIRAEFLARLLLDGPDPVAGRTPGLHLTGARIVGDLRLRGARVDAYVDLRGCRFENRIDLGDATTNTLRIIGSVLNGVRARRARVDGDLCLTTCRIRDGVLLTDAHVANDVVLNGSRIRPMRDGDAVSADGIQVTGDISAHGPFHALGTVRMRSARIGGRVTFYRARLDAPEGLDSRGHSKPAFDGAGMNVEQSLHMSDRFTATGSIRLIDARFGDAYILDHAAVLGRETDTLALWRATGRTLSIVVEPTPRGRVLLSGAQWGALTDVPGTWPEDPGRMAIGGMTYAVLRSTRPMDLAQRLRWLAAATPDYEPQPYEQLALAYRASGQDEEARSVLLAKQRRNRETLRLPGRLWGWVQDVTIGYGYRPARALAWLVALIAIGTTVFGLDRPSPLKADEAPHWNPFFYTIDLLLPVLSLGQESAWNPGGWTQWVAYVLVMLGWILAGAAAAGATRVLNRGA
ncbi:oxidoreductase [Uniformispora flossi]|uniref:oxidoreductase n=1 Tax=Uniformispora flossi TaxID=3390723 RepID=UPI003C2C218C